MLVPFVESGFGGANRFCDREFWIDAGGRDDGQSGSQGAIIDACVEDGGAQPLGGDAVAVSVWDALDEAVQAQATQVVGDASGGILARLVPEQWTEVLANILVGECALDEENKWRETFG